MTDRQKKVQLYEKNVRAALEDALDHEDQGYDNLIADLSVIGKATSLTNVTNSAIEENAARFKEEVKRFRENFS